MSEASRPVRVRFAPSPTGTLHLGGARTALFNYLFARHNQGTFILRMEDTDRARSTAEAEKEVLDSLHWLGLESDEPVIRQTERFDRYAEVAREMLASGSAYRCYCTQEELKALREAAEKAGGAFRYPGTCRDLDNSPEDGRLFVLRLKVPPDRSLEIDDLVRGKVTISSDQVDDWILARSDGTPTYNFTVVVDDSDMAISHVIRGEDHLANTPKQILCYEAMGKACPAFAHVSMILGKDKAKLSKRHGATSIGAFREQGFLPAAMNNFLARLGWAHGDQEVFSMDEMIEHFNLSAVNPAPAIFNPEKLSWVNAQHMKDLTDSDLLGLLIRYCDDSPDRTASGEALRGDRPFGEKMMASLKARARTLEELLAQCGVFLNRAVVFEGTLQEKIADPESRSTLKDMESLLGGLQDHSAASLEDAVRNWCTEKDLKLGKVAQPLRIALTGRKASPPIFEVMEILGPDRVRERLKAAQSLVGE